MIWHQYFPYGVEVLRIRGGAIAQLLLMSMCCVSVGPVMGGLDALAHESAQQPVRPRRSLLLSHCKDE